jgi:hypothetical protein
MPLTLQVPHQPANAAGTFSFTLVQNGTTHQYTLNKNLQENTVEQLRVLAKKIGLSGTARLKKFELAQALAPYVFFRTWAEAAAAWPILVEPLEDTEQGLRDQSMNLRASAGYLDPEFTAHFRTREAEVQAAITTLSMEAARKRRNKPPLWWKAGKFMRAFSDSDEEDEEDTPLKPPYLRVIVQAIERNHDGYCSGVEESDLERRVCCFEGKDVDIVEDSYLMTGYLPLKDPNGANWDFLGPPFDPRWDCASGGSGVCGIRPSVHFVSMTRVE